MSTVVQKEGRKISSARMAKLRALVEQLSGLINEVEPTEKPVLEKQEAGYVIDGKPQVLGTLYKVDEDKRLVLGIALQPGVVDSQGDIIDADEIEKAAHEFLAKSRIVGVMHRRLAKAEVVESYTAPADFQVGEEVVKKGSWVIMVKVRDDGLWAGVKDGSFTGFSIGGTSIRSPYVE